MEESSWTLARLNPEQMQLLSEAEQTLGALYLLAYKQMAPRRALPLDQVVGRLRAAELNDSQVECLRGLESRMDAVVVGYDEPR